MSTLAALRTVAKKPETVIGDVKIGLLSDGTFHILQEVIVELLDLAATKTNQVMMVVLFDIIIEFKPGLPIAVLQLVHNPQFLEDLKGTIDRSQSQLRMKLFRLHEDFLRAHMLRITLLYQNLKYRLALRGETMIVIT